MNKIRTALYLILAIALFSCGNARNEKASQYDTDSRMKDSLLRDSTMHSSAGMEKRKDSTRKFIRTADLKFKVKSVIKSTYRIEDLTNKFGGFVTYTNLASNIDNSTITIVSPDSSLETIYYTVSNAMVIRVPNTKLDTTLKEIAREIEYLDYRIIKAEDVALQILSNNLTQKRAARNSGRLTKAIDEQGKKLIETAVVEDVLSNKQEQADNAKISNLSLADKINFSTISINLYQRQTIKRELIANDKNTNAYEPGFGQRILQSIKTGFTIIEEIIIFLTNLWTLILFGLVLFFGYRWYRIRHK